MAGLRLLFWLSNTQQLYILGQIMVSAKYQICIQSIDRKVMTYQIWCKQHWHTKEEKEENTTYFGLSVAIYAFIVIELNLGCDVSDSFIIIFTLLIT